MKTFPMDWEDFEAAPIFWREGGWTKADHVFGGKLLETVKKLNKEIAA